MIHTMTITFRIENIKLYQDVYYSLQSISKRNGVNLFASNGTYSTYALKEKGFTKITIEKKRLSFKYNHPYMLLTITLSPTKLMGKNMLQITNEEELEELYDRFNEEVKLINMYLPRLQNWTMNRVDYAVNIDTPYVKEYIKLFQRGDKPKGFKELYCTKSKKRKQLEGSLYLFNKSVAINFYDKENEMLKRDVNKYDAKELLRLEVQCKKSKTNAIKIKNAFDGCFVDYFMSDTLSKEYIKYYHNKTIGTGDYYTLSEATTIVLDSCYSNCEKRKLIRVLESVSVSRSVWKARKKSSYSLNSFNIYLKKIRKIGVNPVTIPSSWGVKRLRNIFVE